MYICINICNFLRTCIYIYIYLCEYNVCVGICRIHESKISVCERCPLANVSAEYMSLFCQRERGGGLGSRPKKMYGERLGDGVEYHLMKPTPRR